jgi:hypothetical protein
VFAGFDTASFGYANLFPAMAPADGGAPFVGACPAIPPPGGYGWPIAATPSCKVAQSSLNDYSAAMVDLYGNCRSMTTPTIGAAEYVGPPSCL